MGVFLGRELDLLTLFLVCDVQSAPLSQNPLMLRLVHLSILSSIDDRCHQHLIPFGQLSIELIAMPKLPRRSHPTAREESIRLIMATNEPRIDPWRTGA